MEIFKLDDYRLEVEGKKMRLSNDYGFLCTGEVHKRKDQTLEEWAESYLKVYDANHKVNDFPDNNYIKKVAYDYNEANYIQLQAVYDELVDRWTVQKYDAAHHFMDEDWTGCRYEAQVLDWMKHNYEIVGGLMAFVYKHKDRDCTNGGISSTRDMLYILDKETHIFEPSDLRECVTVEQSSTLSIRAKPIFCPGRWYMAGGNFLYTSDSRFREVTGCSYPVPIHDRYEGR